MQNDYYYYQQPDNNRKKLIFIAIALASLCVVALIVLCTILIVKNIGGGAGGLDPNYITIEFDGTKFKVADTYGEIIREVAKQRTIYDWGGLMDHTYTELTDIENYLSQTINNEIEYSDGNDKNTIIKTNDSDYPDIFIEVDRTIAGLDELATKIDDVDVRIVVYPLNKAKIELKIDGNTLITQQTTSAEFEKMFKDAKEYVSGDSSSQGYKGYDFTYKKRRFEAAFEDGKDTLMYLEIRTYVSE